MTRRGRSDVETAAADRAIDDALGSVARLRATVSVEERVMAAVRVAAARQPRRLALTGRQRAVLGGAGATAALGEVAFWIALGLMMLELPSSVVRALFGWIPGVTTHLAPTASAVADALATLGRAAVTVLEALALLLPPPAAMAALFVLLVSALTFITVRRDLHRSPVSRGLR